MKVLVVDDSKAMRMIVKRQLSQVNGFGEMELEEADSGASGLEWIKTNGEPDLVLSDWNMPEMNGIDFLKALRAAGSAVRFGFVTSESQPEMKAQGIEAGASFFITKPFTAETFQEVLASVMSG